MTLRRCPMTIDWCGHVAVEAGRHLADLLANRPRQEYSVPTTSLDGSLYHVIRIPLTTYYPATPPIPAWLHARYQLLSSYRPRKLPMNDQQLDEMMKRVFGFRQALNNKSMEGSLKLSCRRELVTPFIALMRKTASSSLFSPDVQGMTLLHHACIHNRQMILSILFGQKPNLNVRRTEINPRSTQLTGFNDIPDDDLFIERTGATPPLHFAARCGALECVTALLASKVNPMVSDARNHSAIHHACATGHTAIVRSLLRRPPNLLEMPATGGDNVTPLLAAASNGALQTLKFLLKCGATITACDVNNDGPIQRAELKYHTDFIG
uniref:Ankyrin and armadillo repeat-containing protein n=1 Tax=Phallusia mammillata TaxID=59560 RepID=A0A6F9D741_9ASCI|nr:ankyrin and armadillo repeat-containing protein [Phallusia mammillata]